MVVYCVWHFILCGIILCRCIGSPIIGLLLILLDCVWYCIASGILLCVLYFIVVLCCCLVLCQFMCDLMLLHCVKTMQLCICKGCIWYICRVPIESHHEWGTSRPMWRVASLESGQPIEWRRGRYYNSATQPYPLHYDPCPGFIWHLHLVSDFPHPLYPQIPNGWEACPRAPLMHAKMSFILRQMAWGHFGPLAYNGRSLIN